MRKRQKRIWSGIGVFTLCSVSIAIATPNQQLSLQDYISQVTEKNQTYQSLDYEVKGLEVRDREGDQFWKPTGTALYQIGSDEKETANPAFQGATSKTRIWSLGVSKNFGLGTLAKLTYGNQFYEIDGSSLTQPKYYMGGPTLELTQSLWRNLGAKEWSAQASIQNQQNKSAYWAVKAKRTRFLAEIELAYWRLKIAQDTVALQQEILDRSTRILNWTARRGDLRLADNSDRYQAEAAFAARKLELQVAKDDERIAARRFNHLRGIDSDEATEALGDYTSRESIAKEPLIDSPTPEDLKALEESLALANSQAELGSEKQKPVLELFASYGYNGKDAEFSKQTSESFSSEFPSSTIGIRFAFSLDPEITRKNAQGYNLIKQSVKNQLEQKRKDFAEQWKELNFKRKQILDRLDLAETLEAAQKVKMDHERTRHLKGRTTTYQVLIFEQDYSNARLVRLRTQLELMQNRADLKIFGGL